MFRSVSGSGSCTSPNRPPRKIRRGDHAALCVAKDQIGKDKLPHGEYGDYFLNDLMRAVKRRLIEENELRQSLRAKADMLSYDKLEQMYRVPRSTICDKVKRAKENKWDWDHPALYEKDKGKQRVLPLSLEQVIVDMVMWGDTHTIRQQFTEDECSMAILLLLEDNDCPIPSTWAKSGGPSRGWWADFYCRNPDLSKGNSNRLAEIRATAHSIPAVVEWFKNILEPQDDGWFGFTQEGLTEYMYAEMQHIIDEKEWDRAAVMERAYQMQHNPALQGCFDQKGHAVGGKRVKVMSLKYSRRHCRDVEDGTWVTICPLITEKSIGLLTGLLYIFNIESVQRLFTPGKRLREYRFLIQIFYLTLLTCINHLCHSI